MNFKVVIAITGFVWLNHTEISAQIYSYPEEALSFSRIQPGGTARIRAMGGVQNSLGGDLSSAFYNPAGLGMYNRSEVSFSPGYSIANANSSYLGVSTDASKTNLMIPNLGIAIHTDKDGTDGLWGGTFAINFNRINDFNNTFSYTGTNKYDPVGNTDSSIIDYFIDAANGRDVTQFQSGPQGVNYNTSVGLAYYNYLIGPATELNTSNPVDQYFSYVPRQDIIQSETIKNSGSQNQWSISYGVNFSDRIFIGGGLGLTSLSYKTTAVYTESYSKDPVSKMQLQEDLDISGSGINLTLGLIARPADQVQVGLSMATPTSYSLTENYTATMNTKWNNFTYPANPVPPLNSVSEHTDIVTSSYSMSTPWRFSGGASYFIGKKGFISADVEYMSYGSSRYSNKDGDDIDNQDISELYRSVLNIRAGGEYRLNDFRFRAGYSLMPDPYKAVQNGVDRALTSYTAGFGYRKEKFYIDLATIFQSGSSTHSPYPGSPNVTIKSQATVFMVTVGFPF